MKFTFLIDVSGLAYATVHALCGYKGKNLKADRFGKFLLDENEKNDMLYLLNDKMRGNLSDISKNCCGIEFVFDCFVGSSARYSFFSEYKANREKKEKAYDSASLKKAIMEYKVSLDGMDIRTLELTGVEADDIIAHRVKKLRDFGVNVCIVSSDSDLKQLISSDEKSNVIMLDLGKQIAYVDKNFVLYSGDADGMQNMFGSDDAEEYVPLWLENRQVINPAKELLSKLVSGDTSDNIPSCITYTKGVSVMGITKERIKKIVEQEDFVVEPDFTYSSIKNELLSRLNESVKTKKDPNIIWDKPEYEESFNLNYRLVKLDGSVLTERQALEIDANIGEQKNMFLNFFKINNFEKQEKSWTNFNT